MLLKILQISQKILVPEYLFVKKIAGLVSNFISEDSIVQGFPVSFAKFLNTSILKNTSRWLFCTIFLIFSKVFITVACTGKPIYISFSFIKGKDHRIVYVIEKYIPGFKQTFIKSIN